MKNALPVIAACLLVTAPAAAQQVEVLTAEEAYAAGLLDEPIPEMVIPLDELVSKEDLLDRIAEHVERMAEHARDMEKAGVTVQVAEPFITPGLEKVLEAGEAGDDDRLQEILSDIAGQEVTLPTEEQRRQHDAGAVYTPLETRPPAEVLALMSPDRVEALADYRHILDDRWELIDALNNDNMDSRARSAVRVFLSKSYESPSREEMEAMMPPELKEQIRIAQERGWYEVPSPARGAHLLQEASRLDLPRSSLSAHDEHIPETAASYSFDLPGDARIEVVADTVFGGVLYAEKSEADHVYPDDPNLHILGHDGSVTTRRHADGVWATTVDAFDGSHRYRVTVEKKLEGEERDEFVRMAIAMIEEDLSIPRDAPSSQATTGL